MKSSSKIEIGHRIRQLRGKKNQIYFANKIQIEPKYLSKYETGRVTPPLKVLWKIMEECNISLDWLLAGDEESVDYNPVYNQVLMIPEVQMLIGEIDNIPKEKQAEAAKQALHTVKYWTEERE